VVTCVELRRIDMAGIGRRRVADRSLCALGFRPAAARRQVQNLESRGRPL